MSIKFNQVTHHYEKTRKGKINVDAIKDINLEINDKDEFLMIVGQTGAGKSTLLQHINGLLLPSEGTVEVGSLKLTSKKRKNPKLKNVRKHIGFVFQFPEYQLFEETVLKDIMYGPLNFGYSEEEAKASALDVAKKLDIAGILNESPFNISGGQMRRVAVAGILAYNPDILLLDEPTRGLDPIGAKNIMDFFKELQEKYHKTIIMITHDMDLVYEYATRVVVLQQGEVKYDGAKEDLFIGQYKDYGLDKPVILSVIDEINSKLGRNISYNNYKLKDLISSLERGDK